MAKFKKKPLVVEAIQLTTSNIREVYEFIHGKTIISNMNKWEEYEDSVKKNGLRLKTMESHNETQIASIGDYVIMGVQGEFYPCKPDIFEKTYETAP